MTFAEQIKRLRNDSGLTQQQLADDLGIERATYARYENGSRKPPYDMLLKVADYFGVSTDYLLGRIDTPYYTTEAPASDGTPVRGYSTTNKAPLTPKEVEAVERIEADPEAAGVVKVPLSELLAQEDLPESLRKVLEGIAREAAQKALVEELNRREKKGKKGEDK